VFLHHCFTLLDHGFTPFHGGFTIHFPGSPAVFWHLEISRRHPLQQQGSSGTCL
ncbi:hypothetical protein AVDCRST_MAG81-738, partial [uncultured Synechococcales cyanobacterium]